MAGNFAFIEEIKQAFPSSAYFNRANVAWSHYHINMLDDDDDISGGINIYKDFILFYLVPQVVINKIISITGCVSYEIRNEDKFSWHGEHFEFNGLFVLFPDKNNTKNYLVYDRLQRYSIIDDKCRDVEKCDELMERVRCLDFGPKKEIPYKPVFLD